MDTGNAQNPEDGRLFPGGEQPITIEPIKPRRTSRTVKEIEAMLAAIQITLTTELNLVKQEILDAIREGQASVEAIAREMARRIGENRRDTDGDLP